MNVCRKRLRGAKYRRTADIAESQLTAPDPAPEVHRRLLIAQVFDRLKPDDVVVLALRHFLDLTGTSESNSVRKN